MCRLLNKDEIECRVAQSGKTAKGAWCSILLYKDARVDQRCLDEVYGPMNWKRSHELIGDRLYCTVSVWDNEKKEWVSKQDVGTESNTEPEKGQASDSFKRACFNWGIGRELYTAPKIFVTLAEGEFREDNGKVKANIALDVAFIGYDGSGRISGLVLTDKNGKVRYKFGEVPEKPVTQMPEIKVGDEAFQKWVEWFSTHWAKLDYGITEMKKKFYVRDEVLEEMKRRAEFLQDLNND